MTSGNGQVTRLNYRVEEAAEALGIGITLARQLVKDGTIPSFKLGRRRLILARELERMNEQHAEGWREEQRTESRTWMAS
jgi:excisionase family DNA binding protein